MLSPEVISAVVSSAERLMAARDDAWIRCGGWTPTAASCVSGV